MSDTTNISIARRKRKQIGMENELNIAEEKKLDSISENFIEEFHEQEIKEPSQIVKPIVQVKPQIEKPKKELRKPIIPTQSNNSKSMGFRVHGHEVPHKGMASKGFKMHSESLGTQYDAFLKDEMS